MDAKAETIQVQNRIGDQLPGTVVGDVTPAIGLEELDPSLRQMVRCRQKMLTHSRPPSHGDHGRVVF